MYIYYKKVITMKKSILLFFFINILSQNDIIKLISNKTSIKSLDNYSDQDLNTKKHGTYPLIIAAQEGNYSIVEYLINKGVDVNVIDNLENSALHAVVTFQCLNKTNTDVINRLKIIKLLKQAGINFNKNNKLNKKALDIAREKALYNVPTDKEIPGLECLDKEKYRSHFKKIYNELEKDTRKIPDEILFGFSAASILATLYLISKYRN